MADPVGAPPVQGDGRESESRTAREDSSASSPEKKDAVRATATSSVQPRAGTRDTFPGPPGERSDSAGQNVDGTESDFHSSVLGKEVARDKCGALEKETASSDLDGSSFSTRATPVTRRRSLETLPDVESDASAYHNLLLSFPVRKWYAPPPSLSPFLLARAGFKCTNTGVIECPLCGAKWKWRQMVQHSQGNSERAKRPRSSHDGERSESEEQSQVSLQHLERTGERATTLEGTPSVALHVTAGKELSSSSSSGQMTGGVRSEKDSSPGTPTESEDEQQVGEGLNNAVALSFLHADYCPRKGTFIPLCDVGLSGPSVMPLTLIRKWERRYENLRRRFTSTGVGRDCKLPLISIRSAVGYLSKLIFSQSKSLEALAHPGCSSSSGGEGNKTGSDFPLRELLWPHEEAAERSPAVEGKTHITTRRESSSTATGESENAHSHKSSEGSIDSRDQASPFLHPPALSDDSRSRTVTLMYLLLLLLHPSFAPESVETDTFEQLESMERSGSTAEKDKMAHVTFPDDSEVIMGKEGANPQVAATAARHGKLQGENNTSAGIGWSFASQSNDTVSLRELVPAIRDFADSATSPSAAQKLSIKNIFGLVPVDPMRILALFGWEVFFGKEAEKCETSNGLASDSAPVGEPRKTRSVGNSPATELAPTASGTVLQCTYCLRKVELEKLRHFTSPTEAHGPSDHKEKDKRAQLACSKTDTDGWSGSPTNTWVEECYKYCQYYCEEVYQRAEAEHDGPREDKQQTDEEPSADIGSMEFICGFFMPAPGVPEPRIFNPVHSHRLHCPYTSDAVYKHPCVLEELISALLPCRLRALERAAAEEQLAEETKRAWIRRTAPGELPDTVPRPTE